MHLEGSKNYIADFLSRCTLDDEDYKLLDMMAAPSTAMVAIEDIIIPTYEELAAACQSLPVDERRKLQADGNLYRHTVSNDFVKRKMKFSSF